MKNLFLIGSVFFCAVMRAMAQPDAASIEFVTVGNPGNPDDSTGYGGVDYVFEIGKYEVNNSQYAAFLNSKAVSDPYELYNPSLDLRNGITRQGTDGHYSYTVKAGFERKPVVLVSFYDALRFANWLNNGGTVSSETETGAYKLNGVNPSGFSRTPGAQVFVPSENEWYKAAYFHPANADAPPNNYWLYATRSNLAPIAEPPPGGANSANINSALGSPDLLSDVGAYSSSPSYFGTFDQAGNVWEWTEASSRGGRGIRGGSSENSAGETSSTNRIYDAQGGEWEGGNVGFRIARTAVGGVQSPLITQQPKGSEARLGGSAQFAVVVSPDSGPVSFQWRLNQAPIAGATANPLLVANIARPDFGEYSVEVSNERGSILSKAATLTEFIDSDGDGLSDNYENGAGGYEVIEGKFTWGEAKADAEARGGHLATITSQAEWQRILATVPNVLSEFRWLGLFRPEGSTKFQWVTDESFSYSMWASGQPAGGAGLGDVAGLSPSATWNDVFLIEAAKNSYLLEYGYYSNPNNPDTDGDGFSDFDEINVFHTSPDSADSLPTPLLMTGRHSSFSGYRFTLLGTPNSNYQIETSRNLQDWTPYVNVNLTSPSLLIVDPTSADQTQRFYRARRLP